MFKVGDKVRVVPTIREGWDPTGRMEASVGMVGTAVGSWNGGFIVDFGTTECDEDGYRDFWTYAVEDLEKVHKCKGNKHATVG